MSELDREPLSLDDLLADRACGELDAAGRRELASRLAEAEAEGLAFGDDEDDYMSEFDEVAAMLSAAAVDDVPMPSTLLSELLSRAGEHEDAKTDRSRPGAPETTAPLAEAANDAGPAGGGVLMWLGWAAAAGLGLFLLFGRGEDPVAPPAPIAVADETPTPEPTPEPAPEPTVSEKMDALLGSPGVVAWSWGAAGDETGVSAGGQVVWSAEQQRGFMKFTGLRANDPGVEQYQLWIFDGKRDDRYPVDGGVFDIPAGSDEFVVPIDAKIDVLEAAAFAITVEKPGGVVVSDRGRIALLAKAPEPAGE